jgi:hypothetical protein
MSYAGPDGVSEFGELAKQERVRLTFESCLEGGTPSVFQVKIRQGYDTEAFREFMRTYMKENNSYVVAMKRSPGRTSYVFMTPHIGNAIGGIAFGDSNGAAAVEIAYNPQANNLMDMLFDKRFVGGSVPIPR